MEEESGLGYSGRDDYSFLWIMIGIETFVRLLITGLIIGSMVFLVATGLTIIYGVLGILNFAHGSFFLLGAYFCYALMSSQVLGDNFFVAVAIATVAVALIGGAIELIIFRRVYNYNDIFQLLLTFGLVLIIDTTVLEIWGPDVQSVPPPDLIDGTTTILSTTLPTFYLVIVIITLLITAGVWYLLSRTNLGMKVQAATQDKEIADAYGINVVWLYTSVFVFGSALAGFAGAFTAPYASVRPLMGQDIVIDSFIIIVVGGLGSFPGAFVGAMILGMLDSFGSYLVPNMQSLLPFILLAAILLIKPKGLFGEKL